MWENELCSDSELDATLSIMTAAELGGYVREKSNRDKPAEASKPAIEASAPEVPPPPFEASALEAPSVLEVPSAHEVPSVPEVSPPPEQPQPLDVSMASAGSMLSLHDSLGGPWDDSPNDSQITIPHERYEQMAQNQYPEMTPTTRLDHDSQDSANIPLAALAQAHAQRVRCRLR